MSFPGMCRRVEEAGMTGWLLVTSTPERMAGWLLHICTLRISYLKASIDTSRKFDASGDSSQ